MSWGTSIFNSDGKKKAGAKALRTIAGAMRRQAASLEALASGPSGPDLGVIGGILKVHAHRIDLIAAGQSPDATAASPGSEGAA
jgi:hypothetical protein